MVGEARHRNYSDTVRLPPKGVVAPGGGDPRRGDAKQGTLEHDAPLVA